MSILAFGFKETDNSCMIETISGIFLDKNKVLLLQRAANRSRNKNLWDLMGGDIQEGEEAEEVLHRDARLKLGISIKAVKLRGVLQLAGDTDIVNRHFFVCEGNYSNISLDPKKYSHYDWYTPRQTQNLDLVRGVKDILIHIKFFKMI